jgi:class 3 adenylate cyclase/HAMP domain-containing protein
MLSGVRDRSSLRVSRASPILLFTVVVELMIAAEVIAEPALFAAPAYATIGPVVPVLGALFLIGGLAALSVLSGLATRERMPLALGIAAVPQAFLAYGFIGTGVVTGAIQWTVQTAILLYVAWVELSGRPLPLRPFLVMVALIQSIQGIAMIIDPDLFQDREHYAGLGDHLWLFAPAFVTAGVGLLVAEVRGWDRRRLPFLLLAVVDLAVLVSVFGTTRGWTGVISYSAMAVILWTAAGRRAPHVDARVFLFAAVGAIAIVDLVTWVIPPSGPLPVPFPSWTLMRPGTAVGVAILGLGFYAIAGEWTVTTRRIAAACGAAVVITVIASGALSSTVEPDALVLLGSAVGHDEAVAVQGAASVVLALGLLLLIIPLRPLIGALAHPIIAIGAAGFVVGVLNLLAYMLGSTTLLLAYGPVAMRVHGALALTLFSAALLITGAVHIARRPVGERVFAGMYVLAIVALARSSLGDSALVLASESRPGLGPVLAIDDLSDARSMLLLLGLAGLAWTGILITRTVTRPLAELRRAIQRTAGGERRVQVGIARDDEIGEVIRAFDAMTLLLDRMGELRRFLSPQISQLVLSTGGEELLASHRREVTVVFCDLRGSTQFMEAATPDEVVGDLAFEHQGTIESFAQGDGVLVFFNDPIAAAEHVTHAVRMAWAVHERLDPLSKAWRGRGHDVGYGIGIAVGDATLGRIGFEGRWDYAAIGSPSNRAARLCAHASPGQILVDQGVRDRVGDSARFVSVGELSLKGFDRPVGAFEVVGLD